MAFLSIGGLAAILALFLGKRCRLLAGKEPRLAHAVTFPSSKEQEAGVGRAKEAGVEESSTPACVQTGEKHGRHKRGTYVRLLGLRAEQFNGKHGLVTGFDEAKGR